MAMQYQPGICNIGTSEIKFRKNIQGFGGLAISAALYIILVFLNFPIFGYIFMMAPLYLSALGFLQARSKFCISYARSGKHNMSSEIGHSINVIGRDSRGKDKHRAKVINQRALAIAFYSSLVLLGLSRLLN